MRLWFDFFGGAWVEHVETSLIADGGLASLSTWNIWFVFEETLCFWRVLNWDHEHLISIRRLKTSIYLGGFAEVRQWLSPNYLWKRFVSNCVGIHKKFILKTVSSALCRQTVLSLTKISVPHFRCNSIRYLFNLRFCRQTAFTLFSTSDD